MKDRRQRILSGIDFTKEKGFEIGPLAAPLVRKTDGQILYVDHDDTESIKRKYADDTVVDNNAIVSIDRVCRDGNLEAVLSKDAPFDYAVTSHVIEHIPDPLSWLNGIGSLLKEGGKLRLIVPDYRFTFDRLRQPTVFSDLIDSSWRKLSTPLSRTIYDFLLNHCFNPDPWAPDLKLKRSNDFQIVQDYIRKSETENKYVDMHNSVFDPSSFLRLMVDLSRERLIPYVCCDFFDTELGAIEFFVILEKRSFQNIERRESVDFRAQSYRRFLKESPLRDGTFMRHKGALYLIDRGYKRYVTHPEVISRLVSLGYDFSEKKLIDVSDRDFERVLMGTPLYRTITCTDFNGVEHFFSGDVREDSFQRSHFY